MHRLLSRALCALLLLGLGLGLGGCACDGGPATTLSARLATDLSNNRLVFGAQQPTSQEKEFLLYNQGESSVTVYGVVLSGDDEEKFAVVDAPSFPLVLKPGKSGGVAIKVQLKPGALASDVAQLAFLVTPPEEGGAVVTGGTDAFFVELQREVLRGQLQLSCKGSLDFGIVKHGRAKTLSCEIYNRGQSTVTIARISYRPEAGQMREFTLRDVSLPMVLAPGRQQTLLLVYAPQGDGQADDRGRFVLESDLVLAPGEEVPSIQVKGKTEGDPAPPCLVASQSKIDFGSMRAYCQRSDKTILLENRGGPACGGVRLTLTGIFPSPEAFSLLLAPHSSRIIKPGEKVEIKVRFRALEVRKYQATLVIQSSEGEHATLSIPLFGVGNRGDDSKLITDKFKQVEQPKYDILFVIDNSASMSQVQAALKQNIDYLAQWMTRLNVDYHIMVINTDVSGKTHTAGCARGAVSYITPQTPNQIKTMIENAYVGTQGDNKPQGLQAAVMALSSPASNDLNCNLGFYRDDASLSLAFISNSIDHSSQDVDWYTSFFLNRKGIRNRDLVRASAVVVPPGGCGSQPGSAHSQRYWKIAQRLHGVQASICDAGWGQTLGHVGSVTWGYRRQFFLSQLADPLTIVVKVNGRIAAQGPKNGWLYDPQNNSITFAVVATPPPGSSISVSYQPVCEGAFAP